MVKEVPINVKINEQDRTIIIDGDPSYGKLKILLKSAVTIDGHGNQKIDLDTFLDKLLELCVVSGFDESKDKSKLIQISGTEITYILGEIMKIIPLDQYFKNLGQGNPLSNLIQ